ncbi:MAG TPA: hypothetical protein PKO33_12825 [Pyrinomonadaceae bacterium]|nr:hypothetical protein [Pyrinomonadaceae bacterium]
MSEKKEINFCDGTWKVGDKVFHRIWGWSSVEVIAENSLKVAGQWFSCLGRSMFLDKYPVILPNEYEIPAEAYERPVERPDLAMDTPIWIKKGNSWSRRHFAGWTENGRIKYWSYGQTSHSAEGAWATTDEWRLDDPEKEEK